MVTYEDGIQALITLLQKGGDIRFDQGKVCAYLLDYRGAKPGQVAADARCSSAQVRELAKVWRAFPSEEDRLPYAELDWTYFRLACRKDSPREWLDMACEKEWSTEELRLAITGKPVKDELRAAQRLVNRIDKVVGEGGEAARWLIDTLSQNLKGWMTGLSGGPPAGSASCAGGPAGPSGTTA